MKMNRSGNTLVMVLVASTLILGAVVISMQYVGLTNKSSITALQNSLGGETDLIALNILSGKLHMTKLGTEWGVEPYPIAGEFVSTFKPYVKNFSDLSNGISSLVPNLRVGGVKNASGICQTLGAPIDRVSSVFLSEECERTNFDLDSSRLGSIERGLDITGWSADLLQRRQTELQKGFVGYPDLAKLSNKERDDFLSSNTSLPPGGVNFKAVTFHKINRDSNEPLILTSLEVSVGNTRALIPFPAPPEPTCKLTTAIDARFIDCHQEPTTTYTYGIIGYRNVTTDNYVTSTVATSTPRTNLVVCRCSNTNALFQPLEPRVDNCNGFIYNRGCLTYSSTTNPLYRVNLAARGNFSYRGRIYATNLAGEQLNQAEINGAVNISFSRLLQEMGVSPTIPGTQQVSTNSPITTSVPQYGPIAVYGSRTVCQTRQTPECNGDCIEIASGRGVRTGLFADSILGSAKLSGDSFTNYKNVTFSERQTIKDIRAFESTFPNEPLMRRELGSELLKPPSDLYIVQGPRVWIENDGKLDDEHGRWTVKGRVTGLKRASANTDCEKDFKVFPPPPPACVASVANPRILKGASTVVTLNCSSPTSGRVTGAKFLTGGDLPSGNFAPAQRGTSSYKIATATYTRTTDYRAESINIIVTGPGAPNGIVVTTFLGEVCPHNDPSYVSYIQITENNISYPRAPLRRESGVIAEGINDGWQVYESPTSIWNSLNAHGTDEYRWDPRKEGNPLKNYLMESRQVTKVTQANGGGGLIDNPRADGYYLRFRGIGYWAEIGPKEEPSCSIIQYALRRYGCFTSDTRIRMADGREKLVSEVSENDLIWNPLYQSPVKVTKIVKGPEKKALYQLRVAKNRLVVTEGHPFLTQRGWVRTDELSTKDLIMGEGLGKQILSVKKLSYKTPVEVFNFELDTDIPEGHVVIANGIPTGDLTTQIAIKQNRENLP